MTILKKYFHAGLKACSTRLQPFRSNVSNHVADAARVSPLVVVPGDHLDAIAGDHAGHGRIHNGGARIAAEVNGDQLVFLVT